MARCRFVVTGRVQGVGFRWAARAEAARLGLVGFVGNCSDGSVAGEAAGAPTALASFHRWLQQGPPRAQVETVAWSEIGERGGEVAFTIAR